MPEFGRFFAYPRHMIVETDILRLRPTGIQAAPLKSGYQPLSEGEAAMTQQAQAPLIAISNHDPVLLRLLDNALADQGFRSMILPHGSTAYEVIKKTKPDLIMLDVGGSPEDSWVLFQILRLDEETIHIPVLIASSDPTQFQKTALGLEQHSGVDVIDKPYDRRLLYERITDLLQR